MSRLTLGKGWKGFRKLVGSGGRLPTLFGPVLEKNVGRATRANAVAARKQIRQEIKAGVPPPNAELTARLKSKGKRRTTKPIVGTPGADLFNAVTWDVESWDRATVGVKRTSEAYNVGKIVHEGATIRVTEKMRYMFQMLAWAARSQKRRPHLEGRALELWEAGGRWNTKWRPLRPETKVIVIPKRPFVRYAMQDPQLKNVMETNWTNAVRATLKYQARRAMKI